MKKKKIWLELECNLGTIVKDSCSMTRGKYIPLAPE